MDALEGIDWRLVAYAGDDGALHDVPDGVVATARFEDGRLTGSGGCNRFNGGWTATDQGVSIGPVAATMMACEGVAMAVESAYLAQLAAVARATTADDRLDLLAVDARVLLRFAASSVTLAGERWIATGVNNGRGGVQSLVEGTEITAELGDDGRIAGAAGCNRYTGTWSVTSDTISLGPLATTRRLCPRPDGVMEQEAAFLAAMARTAKWRIDGEDLELRDAGGALQVSFRLGRPG